MGARQTTQLESTSQTGEHLESEGELVRAAASITATLGSSSTPGYDRELIPSLSTIWEFAVCVLVAASVRLLWAFMTPMPEAPDEHCHLWVTRFLFEHSRLPHVKDVLDAGIIGVYGSLPQLGYLPHVLMAHLMPFVSVPLACRFGSVALGVAAVAVTYAVARELFKSDKTPRLVLPLLVALHPQLVFVNAYTNTDSTVTFLGAAITWLCVRTIYRGLNDVRAALLGLLLGFLALTKYSAYSLFFGAGFAVIASAYLHKVPLLSLFRYVSIAAVSLIASCGWWFVRQMHEYPGDLLGTKTMYHTWAVRFNKPLEFKVGLWQIVSMPAYWRMKIYSYWGLFGCLKRYLWHPFYVAYVAIMGVAAGGLAFYAAKTIAATRLVQPIAVDRSDDATTCGIELKTLALLCTCLLCLAVNLASMIWAASVNLGLAQGRYLFGAEVPIMLLIIYGARSFGTTVGNRTIVLLLVTNVLALLYQFRVLYPLYGFHFA
ncbi:MAG TPA: hypothetical protein V6C97_15015 [Oculatellaceae cyanobacterium]